MPRIKRLSASLCAGLLAGLAVLVFSPATAQAAPLIQFKNSVNSASAIYVYNAYAGANGSPWRLSVNETNWVDDYGYGIRVDRGYYSPHSFRWHYDGTWHVWHCDETSAPNPPNGKSPVTIQVENDHRC